jgi:hypothetical protein
VFVIIIVLFITAVQKVLPRQALTAFAPVSAVDPAEYSMLTPP